MRTHESTGRQRLGNSESGRRHVIDDDDGEFDEFEEMHRFVVAIVPPPITIAADPPSAGAVLSSQTLRHRMRTDHRASRKANTRVE